MSKPQGVVTAGRALAAPVYGLKRHPALKWLELAERRLSGTWEPGALILTEKLKWKNHEGESTEAVHRGGTTRSSDEISERGWSEGVVLGSLIQ